MQFSDFLGSMKGEVLKNMLLKSGIDPQKIQGVDFNNMDQINQFAEQVAPDLIKKNPFIATIIKQNSSMMGEKGKEVVDVIDKI